MTTVVGVSFVRAGKVYWFDPNGLDLKDGLEVIVDTSHGLDFGVISGVSIEVTEEQVVQPLRKVLRLAVKADIDTVENNKRKERDAFGIAQDKIARHKLEMKLVDVEYAFDNTRIVFYFTANGRVDFRELVKDMAMLFRTRIELRQIGVRDEAKMIGGLGPCGRPICCRQFLVDFQPVSIKMAKEQNLSLNPTKISGLCGRLMCCLKYEQDTYEAARKSMPKLGREVDTPQGPGTVVDVNVLKERLTIKVQLRDGTWEYQYFPFASLAPHKAGEKHVLLAQAIEPNNPNEDLMMGEVKEAAKPSAPRSPRPRPTQPAEQVDAQSKSPTTPTKPRPQPRAQEARTPAQQEPTKPTPPSDKPPIAQGERAHKRRPSKHRSGGTPPATPTT